MPATIPEEWRIAVRKTLRRSDMRQIFLRTRARNDWQALFPECSFDYELFAVLAAALDGATLQGNLVTGMKEAGTTYEFIFTYKNRPIYSKINLLPDNTVIIIYSAHTPLKGDSL